jgi:hypothetical protein
MHTGGIMAMEEEAKNGMLLKRLLDSHQIKKHSMKDLDNLGLEVKTKEIVRQLITLFIEDQRVILSPKQMQMQEGGLTVTELEVKNGTHLKRLPDSPKIKTSSMKVQGNHGSIVKTKEIKNQHTTYSTLDQDLNLSHKPILINLFTEMGKI